MSLPFFPQPKTRPRVLDKADRAKAIVTTDQAESLKAKKRAAGRCELFVVGEGRYPRKDVHTHHLQSGRGRRAHGTSALAEHKLRVCVRCHTELHQHLLVPEGAVQDQAFRRVK